MVSCTIAGSWSVGLARGRTDEKQFIIKTGRGMLKFVVGPLHAALIGFRGMPCGTHGHATMHAAHLEKDHGLVVHTVKLDEIC